MSDLADMALFEPSWIPLCPQCESDKVVSSWSVKRISREEWEANKKRRDLDWLVEKERHPGRFRVDVQTPGWDDNWTECWTTDKVTSYDCTECDFTAPTDEPFIEARKAKHARERAEERREFERTSALPLDDPDHWCSYCEQNAYDGDTCEECGGDGCDECADHGYWGYSW